MLKIRIFAVLAVALLFGGCSHPTPTPVVAGPMDPNSTTVFTLALQPDSISGCVLSDPSMTRPITVTVRNDRGELMTDGGIHIDMTRVRPNVYIGNLQMGTLLLQAEANLSVSPGRLTVSTAQQGCRWAATAA
jgi:hypothetical protein